MRSEYEETQTILTDNCSQYGITATCFDTHENLLWVGNQLVSKHEIINYFFNFMFTLLNSNKYIFYIGLCIIIL